MVATVCEGRRRHLEVKVKNPNSPAMLRIEDGHMVSQCGVSSPRLERNEHHTAYVPGHG